MYHEDIDQRTLDNLGYHSVWTFCSCGLAFGGKDGDEAYARWEWHEARANA